jgi:hypothetical protein
MLPPAAIVPHCTMLKNVQSSLLSAFINEYSIVDAGMFSDCMQTQYYNILRSIVLRTSELSTC